jgi:hypothetical protein
VKESKKTEPEPSKEEIQASPLVEIAAKPLEEFPSQVVEPEIESVVTEELAPLIEDEPVVEISSSEIVEQKSETQEEQPLAEGVPPLVGEKVVVAYEPPVDPAAAKIEFLEAEISRLKAELDSERKEHETDLARAAGGAKASLETIDRMYNERELAISIARQSLLVTDLLQQLASDDLHLSPGSLKTDFQARKEEIIEACFRPQNVRFIDVVLSKLFSAFYSISGGKILAAYGDNDLRESPTWNNLRAVHLAESALGKNDFREAMDQLSAIRGVSNDAAQWVDRTRQALELWQGSRAALASMHDELSRVL